MTDILHDSQHDHEPVTAQWVVVGTDGGCLTMATSCTCGSDQHGWSLCVSTKDAVQYN